jgi:hypothetical protein
MNESTKQSLARYYARISDDDLTQCKADIGELLKHSKVQNLDDIKENISLINNEIKIRLQRKV